MRLQKQLYWVGSGDMGLSLTHPQDCNVYVIDYGQGLAMVDAGVGLDVEGIERQMAADGLNPANLTHLLLTHGHADHMGGAAYFKEKYHLRVLAPAAEADYIATADGSMLGLTVALAAGYYPKGYVLTPCAVDHRVSAGDSFELGGDIRVAAYEASGHSIGGVCYHVTLENRHVLFTGDLICHGGKISLQNIPGANVHNYSRSVLALESVDVDLLAPGHHCPSLNRGKIHIDAACEAFRKLGIPQNVV